MTPRLHRVAFDALDLALALCGLLRARRAVDLYAQLRRADRVVQAVAEYAHAVEEAESRWGELVDCGAAPDAECRWDEACAVRENAHEALLNLVRGV